MLIFPQIIDYVANNPLHNYVQTNYGDHPFDSILDAVGSQDLYVHCPTYLKPNGIYVNVGSLEDTSLLQSLWRWVKNSHAPSILGGTPRKFCMFGGSITKDGVRKLAQSAEKGDLRVFVDSVVKMEDALAVCGDPRASLSQGKPV